MTGNDEDRRGPPEDLNGEAEKPRPGSIPLYEGDATESIIHFAEFTEESSPPASAESGGVNGFDKPISAPKVRDGGDVRLYVPDSEAWTAQLKYDTSKIYCYSRNPGEDYFHLILNGEIYLVHDDEKYCLSCALRLGVATQDRLFWQRRPTGKKTQGLR